MSKISKNLLKFERLVKKLKFEKEDVIVLDENKVKISDKIIGGTVEVINDDETLSPATDGYYQVGDFKFIVKDGVISEIIEEIDGEFEGEEAEDKASVDQALIEEVKSEITEVAESVEVLVETIGEMLSDIKLLKEQKEKSTIKTSQSFSGVGNDLKSKINNILGK